jgi:hypothetical protein
MKEKGQHDIVSDQSIRTATSADAERCLAVLTLAFRLRSALPMGMA